MTVICQGRLIPAHAGKTTSPLAMSLTKSAHPRSRGENTGSAGGCLIVTGSSPLTRGKRLAARSGYDPGGLIPAHAGKTRSRICSESAPAAHPRSRGENTADDALTQQPAGSSPLTRGKPTRHTQQPSKPGLIPAHAGKTRRHNYHQGSRWAHPRSRGENATRASAPSHEAGSSPLTRGKLCLPRGRKNRVRLIPAHAGKTAAGKSPPPTS